MLEVQTIDGGILFDFGQTDSVINLFDICFIDSPRVICLR